MSLRTPDPLPAFRGGSGNETITAGANSHVPGHMVHFNYHADVWYHVMPNINSVGSRVLKCSNATMMRLRTIIISTVEPLSCNHDSVGIFVYIS